MVNVIAFDPDVIRITNASEPATVRFNAWILLLPIVNGK